ncbi:MAG: helix-turn-helix transcriptional regulator, partial [Candidatus Hodarchaeota archaeon]
KTLLSEISRNRQNQRQNIEKIVEAAKLIINYWKTPSKDKIARIQDHISGFAFRTAKLVMEHALALERAQFTEDFGIDLEFLAEYGTKLLEQEYSQQEIWKSITTIYPIMKDLQEKGYIEVSRETTEEGRSRKLYRITNEGRSQAVAMFAAFSEINHNVLSELHVFNSEMPSLFDPTHQFIQIIMNLLLPDPSLLSEIYESEYSDIQEVLEFIFPMARNKTLFTFLLLDGFLDYEMLSQLPFKAFHIQIIRQYLLNILHSLREKIDDGIKALESKNISSW